MKRFGLTGGVACGKSTVAAILRQMGSHVLDADALWHDLAKPGSYVLTRIAEEFGARTINEDGSLNRKELAAKVFGDDYARAKLNAITHPHVNASAEEKFAELEDDRATHVFYESALIFETHTQHKFDATVTVWAPAKAQIDRLFIRNGIERAEAEQRIAAQLRTLDKIKLATHDIYTGGTLDEVWEETAYVRRALTHSL